MNRRDRDGESGCPSPASAMNPAMFSRRISPYNSPQACPVYRCIFLDNFGKMLNAHVKGENRDTLVVMTPPKASEWGTTMLRCKKR